MVLVSAVVSAHEEGDLLGRCLESVLSQTYPVDELIVIVDKGDKFTLEVAKASPATVYTVEHGSTYMTKRAGIYAAMNDVVLSVDGDTLLAQDFLDRGVQHLEDGYDAVTGHVYSLERTPMGDLAGFICNLLPAGIYASGPGHVINRKAYQDLCKVTKIGSDVYVDSCVGADEIPLQRMNLIKDPEMKMLTLLPSRGQRQMITGARSISVVMTALRLAKIL